MNGGPLRHLRRRVGSRLPCADWLTGYRRQWLRPDLVAGLTSAAVVLPKAMAYATIAGLPLEVGLYTALVPMAVYALFGTSRPLSVSTTTTIAILAAAELGTVSAVDMAAATATLTLLVGAMLILAFILRLGFIANFISEPVLTGFKAGIALVIVLDQLPKLLGIHIDKGGFFHNLMAIGQHLPETSLPTLLVALAVLVLIFGLERFAPRAPIPLIAIGAGIAASALFGLQWLGVATVGAIPRALPSLRWPELQLALQLWPAALGIALMSFTESIAAARAFRQPGEPRPAANAELLALGLANAGGALLGAMPAGGGTSQTAVNRKAGARTPLAQWVTAGAALATLLLLAPLIAPLPQAVLAAVVIAYSLDLIKPAEFIEIVRVRRAEFLWAIIALAGVVLLGTLQGILVAIITSLVVLAHQAYKPPVYVLGRKPGTDVFRSVSPEHADDEQWPGLLIVRIVGRAFFANAPGIGERLSQLIEAQRPAVVLMDCSAMIDLEYTALKMLTEAEQRLQGEHIALWMAALQPEVLAVVRRSQLGETLGRERMFFSVPLAVEHYQRTFNTVPG